MMYEKPQLECVLLDTEEVIRTSLNGNEIGDGDGIPMPAGLGGF